MFTKRPKYKTKAEISQMLMTKPTGTRIRTEGWLTSARTPTPYAQITLNTSTLAGQVHTVVYSDGSTGKLTWQEIVSALWELRVALNSGGIQFLAPL